VNDVAREKLQLDKLSDRKLLVELGLEDSLERVV